MEFSIGFQDIAAIITLITGFYIAIANRNKTTADIHTLALDSAAKSINLREKDIVLLEKKVDRLEKYVRYLLDWVRERSGAADLPMSFDEFEIAHLEE